MPARVQGETLAVICRRSQSRLVWADGEDCGRPQSIRAHFCTVPPLLSDMEIPLSGIISQTKNTIVARP